MPVAITSFDPFSSQLKLKSAIAHSKANTPIVWRASFSSWQV